MLKCSWQVASAQRQRRESPIKAAVSLLAVLLDGHGRREPHVTSLLVLGSMHVVSWEMEHSIVPSQLFLFCQYRPTPGMSIESTSSQVKACMFILWSFIKPFIQQLALNLLAASWPFVGSFPSIPYLQHTLFSKSTDAKEPEVSAFPHSHWLPWHVRSAGFPASWPYLMCSDERCQSAFSPRVMYCKWDLITSLTWVQARGLACVHHLYAN